MTVAANGIRIHVKEQDKGDLPLVFLHYWGGSSRIFDHVVEALSTPHRTVATDRRGWGHSDSPPMGYSLADLAADAEGLIEELYLQLSVGVGAVSSA